MDSFSGYNIGLQVYYTIQLSLYVVVDTTIKFNFKLNLPIYNNQYFDTRDDKLVDVTPVHVHVMYY